MGLAAEDQALRLRRKYSMSDFHAHASSVRSCRLARTDKKKARNSCGRGQPKQCKTRYTYYRETTDLAFSRSLLDEREYLHIKYRHICARNWDRVRPYSVVDFARGGRDAEGP